LALAEVSTTSLQTLASTNQKTDAKTLSAGYCYNYLTTTTIEKELTQILITNRKISIEG
jgi:hypothetical protein